MNKNPTKPKEEESTKENKPKVIKTVKITEDVEEDTKENLTKEEAKLIKEKESEKQKNEEKPKDAEKPKSLFNFSPNGIFASSTNQSSNSLFGNTSSLFSNSNTNSLFNFTSFSKDNTNTNSFFNNLSNKDDAKESDNEDNKEDVFGDAPQKEEEPTKLVQQESSFDKKFSQHIDKIYVYKRDEKKYVSKGNGYLSVETAKETEKAKMAVVVFRNQMGTKIIEGFLNEKLKKIETYMKNYKYVASFSYIEFNEKKEPIVGFAKVPFAHDDELKMFEKGYNEALDYLT